MTILHDLLFRPTDDERALRGKLEVAQAHAENLEELLLVQDPREAFDPAIHSRVCWERQRAAHAWRKASTMQSQLNGAEIRRYSRGLTAWVMIGFGAQFLLKGGFTLDNLTAIAAFFLKVI